ncbi:probable N-acetyltransferase 14 isoform X1 [Notamacropus eugenii]|uniref:probable N-acetyltransferase 14 isoform X1 n=1 Tax=Notamacropus eugenii TaxID=9315 RepID=UPI003B67E159
MPTSPSPSRPADPCHVQPHTPCPGPRSPSLVGRVPSPPPSLSFIHAHSARDYQEPATVLGLRGTRTRPATHTAAPPPSCLTFWAPTGNKVAKVESSIDGNGKRPFVGSGAKTQSEGRTEGVPSGRSSLGKGWGERHREPRGPPCPDSAPCPSAPGRCQQWPPLCPGFLRPGPASARRPGCGCSQADGADAMGFTPLRLWPRRPLGGSVGN